MSTALTIYKIEISKIIMNKVLNKEFMILVNLIHQKIKVLVLAIIFSLNCLF